jgi:hypothetical protein
MPNVDVRFTPKKRTCSASASMCALWQSRTLSWFLTLLAKCIRRKGMRPKTSLARAALAASFILASTADAVATALAASRGDVLSTAPHSGGCSPTRRVLRRQGAFLLRPLSRGRSVLRRGVPPFLQELWCLVSGNSKRCKRGGKVLAAFRAESGARW